MQEQEKKCWNSKYSRIKLSVYDTNNKLNVFFSFIREERKGDQATIDNMKQRILAKYYNNQFRKAFVWDNQTDTLIEKLEPEPEQTPEISRIKLVVYDTLNRRIERYSNKFEDQKTIDFAVGSMHVRVLQLELRGRFNAAIFYDAQTGSEISRAEPYRRAWKTKKGVTPYPQEHSQKVPHTFAMS